MMAATHSYCTVDRDKCGQGGGSSLPDRGHGVFQTGEEEREEL